jgi:hypothetical protein
MGASFSLSKIFFAKYQKLIIIAKAVVVRVLKKRKKMESQKYTLTITCYSDTLVAELNDGDGVPILKTTYAIVDGIDIQKLEEKIFLEIENLFQELNVKYDLTKKESHSDLGPITYPWGD